MRFLPDSLFETTKRIPMATRRHFNWRAAFLIVAIALRGGGGVLLAQDIIGAADPIRDIEGGAVGVLKNPPVKKRHNTRAEKPAPPPKRTPQPNVQIARVSGERRKPRAVAPTPRPPRPQPPRPPRPTPDAASYNAEGDDYFDDGEYEEAIESYQQAIRLKPNYAEAYSSLGDAEFSLRRYQQAIEAYKQAARLRPDMAEAYYNLGMAYLETGDRASAIVQLRQLQALDAKLYGKLLSETQR